MASTSDTDTANVAASLPPRTPDRPARSTARPRRKSFKSRFKALQKGAGPLGSASTGSASSCHSTSPEDGLRALSAPGSPTSGQSLDSFDGADDVFQLGRLNGDVAPLRTGLPPLALNARPGLGEHDAHAFARVARERDQLRARVHMLSSQNKDLVRQATPLMSKRRGPRRPSAAAAAAASSLAGLGTVEESDPSCTPALEQDNIDFRAMIRDFETRLQQRDSELVDLRSQVDLARSDKGVAESMLASAQQDLQSNGEQMARMVQQLRKLQAAAAAGSPSGAAAAAAAGATGPGTPSGSAKELAALTARFGRLEEDKDQLQEELDDCLADLDQLRAQAQRAQAAMAQRDQTIAERDQTIAAAEAKLAQQEREITSMGSTVTHLSQRLSAADGHADHKLKSTLQELADTKQALVAARKRLALLPAGAGAGSAAAKPHVPSLDDLADKGLSVVAQRVRLLRSEEDQLVARVQQLQTRLKELKLETKAVEESKLHDSPYSADMKNQVLRQRIAALESSTSLAQQEALRCQEASIELQAARDRIHDLNKQRKKENKNTVRLQHELIKAREREEAAQQKYDALRDSTKDRMSTMKSQSAGALKRVSSLEKQLDALRHERDVVQRSATELQRQLDSQASKFDTLTVEKAESAQELSERICELEGTLSSARAEAQDLQTVSRQMDALKQRCATLEAVAAQAARLRAERDQARQECTKSRAQVERLTSSPWTPLTAVLITVLVMLIGFVMLARAASARQTAGGDIFERIREAALHVPIG